MIRIGEAQRLALSGALALCLASCCCLNVVAPLWSRGNPGTEEELQEAWAKLHVGMTEDEVSDLLGDYWGFETHIGGPESKGDYTVWTYPFGSVRFEGNILYHTDTLVSWSRPTK